MDWNVITGLAEVLGALAVIISLAYLAFQIRQNTRSIEGATEQSLMSAEMSLYGLLAEHASVYRRGCINIADLTPDEVTQFEQLVLAVMSQLYGAYVQYKRKLIPISVWNAYTNDWNEYVSLAGFQDAWSNLQSSYPKEFNLCLDKVEKANVIIEEV